jgi:hypothetical protein
MCLNLSKAHGNRTQLDPEKAVRKLDIGKQLIDMLPIGNGDIHDPRTGA